MVHWADRVLSMRAGTLLSCFDARRREQHHRWRDEERRLHHQPHGGENSARVTDTRHRCVDCSADVEECQFRRTGCARQAGSDRQEASWECSVIDSDGVQCRRSLSHALAHQASEQTPKGRPGQAGYATFARSRFSDGRRFGQSRCGMRSRASGRVLSPNNAERSRAVAYPSYGDGSRPRRCRLRAAPSELA